MSSGNRGLPVKPDSGAPYPQWLGREIYNEVARGVSFGDLVILLDDLSLDDRIEALEMLIKDFLSEGWRDVVYRHGPFINDVLRRKKMLAFWTVSVPSWICRPSSERRSVKS